MTPADQNLETKVVARGAFINLIGNLGKLSHFFFDLIATRVMGQQVFGYFSTTWLIMNLAYLICYFGAHRLVIDFVARGRADNDEEYYRGISAYIVLSWILSAWLVVFMYFFADDIAAFIDKPPVGKYLRIMSWATPFYCMTTILLTATRGLKIMKLWVIIRNGVEPLSDLLMILLLFFVFGLDSAPVAAKSIGFTVGFLASGYLFSRHFSFRKLFAHRPGLTEWKRIASFGLPVTFADFLTIVILKVDIIVLSIIGTASQVAVFQVILNIANTMRNIPQAVDPIMMPVVVDMRQQKNYSALERIYASVMRVSLFLSLGFFVLCLLFGHLLLGLYGEGFVAGTTALVLACAGIMLHTVSSSIEPVLIMSGYPYLNLFNNILFVSVNLVLDFILIPHYGIVGAGIGCLVASAATASFQVSQLYVRIRIRPLRRDLWRVFAFAGAFGIVFRAAQAAVSQWWWLDIVFLVLFLMAYLALGWRWVFDDADRDTYSVIFKRKAP